MHLIRKDPQECLGISQNAGDNCKNTMIQGTIPAADNGHDMRQLDGIPLEPGVESITTMYLFPVRYNTSPVLLSNQSYYRGLPLSTQTKAPDSLKESFDYLYKTYFGELQIEKDEMERLPGLLDGCQLFIDVGASLGMYTYFANKILENAEIIAIEADPDRFRELEKNCAKWEQEGSNRIRAVFAAAGDSRDTLEFFKTGSHISGSVFTIPERSDTYERVEVPQIMLDDYYLPGRKTFVKIDVEGAEYRVMEGATQLVENGTTQFAIGIHSWGDKERKKTPMGFLRLLYSKNMSISKTSNHMTSNYLFGPAKCGKIALFVSYLKYTPMLLFRQTYRWAVPRPVGRAMEKMFNALRQRRFAT